jgi:hypothetical protein
MKGVYIGFLELFLITRIKRMLLIMLPELQKMLLAMFYISKICYCRVTM